MKGIGGIIRVRICAFLLCFPVTRERVNLVLEGKVLVGTVLVRRLFFDI